MNLWTNKRKATLGIHIALAIGLMIWSLSSSFHFWSFAYRDEIYAWGTVLFVDGVALLGLILRVTRIRSPLTALRHLLPAVSALPLAFDMHNQFSIHADIWLVWSLTIGITAILVALSAVVWRFIEQTFVSIEEASLEIVQEPLTALRSLQAMRASIDAAMHDLVPVQQLARPQETFPPPMQWPAPDAMHDDADNAPDWLQPMQKNPTFVCARCSSTVEITNGADPVARRKASGRYGCVNCKG